MSRKACLELFVMPRGFLLCIQRGLFPSQLTTPSVKLLIDVALNQTWGGREGHAAMGASVASAKLDCIVSPDVMRPLQAFDAGRRARQCRLNSKLHVVCDGPGAGARAPPNTTASSTNSAIGSRTCLPASRIGVGSPPVTINAANCSSQQPASPQPSCSGYESCPYA